jgi:hypothetical protein
LLFVDPQEKLAQCPLELDVTWDSCLLEEVLCFIEHKF